MFLRGTVPDNDRRTARYFAILPLRIGGKIVWLKRYYVDEYYVRGWTRGSYPGYWDEFKDTRRLSL